MLNLVNDRRTELKEQAAEDKAIRKEELKEQAAEDKRIQKEEKKEQAAADKAMMAEEQNVADINKANETNEANEANVVNTLYNIANSLDKKGLHKEADLVTETMVAIAAGEETGFYGHDYDDSKRTEPAVEGYGYADNPTLSVANCPDHRGTRLIHVDDSVYQCPIDGKVYNWAEGFTALDGTKYRGGDVASQTPDTPSWGGAPSRWFEGQGR